MKEDDLVNFRQVMENSNSHKWIDAVNEKIKSMKDNDVWDIVSFPEYTKYVGYK